MRCPGCGLYHPSQYEDCVSCGMSMKTTSPSDVGFEEADMSERGQSASSRARAASPSKAGVAAGDRRRQSGEHMRNGHDYIDDQDDSPAGEKVSKGKRRSSHLKHQSKAGIPTSTGLMTGLVILLVTAGATFFFLTRTPDDERVLQKGREELSRNQYAFAVETLERAAKLKPKDPRVFLLLARAYVGISDVDKAWQAISHAQQLGQGVVAEPDLASDLANYYMKRQQYAKAIELLRPLAQQNIGDKKAELADLDAAYGDTLLGKEDLEGALKCWEEVRDLKAGSRLDEAEARLATIYEKMANKFAAEHKDTEAIAYLSKLTSMAHNPKHYLAMADIYERGDKLDLAIEQLRKANELSKSAELQKRLSTLLAKRGKELLDSGQDDVGYAYLQQARSMDASNAVPDLALRKIDVGLDPFTHMPRIQGEVWNPGDTDVGKLSLRAELFDNKTQHSLWSKDTRVVDEFVKPLGGHDSKAFNFTANVPSRMDGTVEFRMYLNNSLYKAYTLEKRTKGSDTASGASDEPPLAPAIKRAPEPVSAPSDAATAPPVAPGVPGSRVNPPPATAGSAQGGAQPNTTSPEEKTLKDLDF